MNIAICISGFIRNSLYNKSLFTNLIDNNPNMNFNIFIDTWDVYNSSISHAFIRRNYDNFNKVDINKLIENYKPNVINIENYNNEIFNYYEHYKGTNITQAVFSQFYKVQKCKRLMTDYMKSNNCKYDYIIRTRFDLIYNKINLLNFDTNIMFFEEEHISNWISDKFSISNYQNFIIYSDFFDNLER